MTDHEALALKVAFTALLHGIDATIGVAARLSNGDEARDVIEELTGWKKDLEEAITDLEQFLRVEREVG